MHAGFRSPEAPIIYRAIQLSSMAGFLLIVAGVCAVLGKPLGDVLIYIIVAFVAGFFLPRYFLSRITKTANANCVGVADALDLMVVSLKQVSDSTRQ